MFVLVTFPDSFCKKFDMRRQEVVQKVKYLGREIFLKNGKYFIVGEEHISHESFDLAKKAIEKINERNGKNG